MKATITKTLKSLDEAWQARRFYPQGHPSIRLAEEEVIGSLEAHLTEDQCGDLSMVISDDQVIVDEKAIEIDFNGKHGFLQTLRDLGADKIRFLKGVSQTELRSFLDGLIQPDENLARPDTPHINLSTVKNEEKEGQSDQPASHEEYRKEILEQADQLESVWEDVFHSHGQKLDMLGRVVHSISGKIGKNLDCLVPLANIKENDAYTFVHTVNVAILSNALAEAVGIRDELLQNVLVAALLHDIGKLELPKSILNKTAKLSDEDFAKIRKHPIDGARILLENPRIHPLAAVVAFEHHIHCNGSGYPDAGVGWKPNLASRIVQVADVFDALRTHRPYRESLSQEAAVAILKKDAGTLLDKTLVDIFVNDVIVHETRI